MTLKVRFIIIAILLGLRLYGANSELIKAATAIGMTFTAFSILYTLIKGRNRRPMGGNVTFAGILTAVAGVICISALMMKTGITFFLLPIIFISLATFALSIFLMKNKNPFSLYMGGVLGGGAVSVVALAFVLYLTIGATNGFTPVNETFNVALTDLPFDIPFAWAK